MNDLMDILIGLLPEFDLPEPESPYSLKVDDQEVKLLMAFVDKKLGIREGYGQEVRKYGDWRTWECSDEQSARTAFTAIAREFGIEPTVMRLDFSKVDLLIDAGQWESAKSKLEELQEKIEMGHPDWAECEKRRKKIKKAKKKGDSEDTTGIQMEIPQISFVKQLQADAGRISAPDTPEFNILGLFSPDDESMSAIDAVWVAKVKQDGIILWAACLEGNPAYQSDSNWETVGTEAVLLKELLNRIDGGTTFLWDYPGTLLLIQNWHQRAMGIGLSKEAMFIDLQALCKVAHPLAHRTDLPESLCKQLKLEFQDEMGIGGPLAAMVCLIGSCADTLRALDHEVRSALRMILSIDVLARSSPMDMTGRIWGNSAGKVIPEQWLDSLIPPGSAPGVDGYLELLKKYHKSLPLLIQQSTGTRENQHHDLLDFFRNGGFLAQAANFQYRERGNQIAFSQKIEEALSEERPYMLEAGTGIGKTIGYLIPLLLSGKRAYVSTHTKALQDQAWEKDVPLTLKALSIAGVERSVSIIKGKGNYVCLQAVADWLDEPKEIIETGADAYFFAALLRWLLLTETGWLSEIEHLGDWHLLNLLGRDQAAPKLQEIWADIDPHARAREATNKADIVLANHSYVFALTGSTEPGKSNIDSLILDEAHNIDTVVTEVLTTHFRPWVLKHEIDSVLRRDDKGKIQGLYRALMHHPQIDSYPWLATFRDRLERSEKKLHQWCGEARKRLCEMLNEVQDFDPDLPIAFKTDDFWVTSLYDSAKELLDVLQSLSLSIEASLEQIQTLKGLPKKLPSSLGSLGEHVEESIEALSSLFDTGPNIVRWGEAKVRIDDHGKIFVEDDLASWTTELRTTPLDISGWLRDNINSQYKHRVYLSATMSIGGDFSLVVERFGLTTDEDGKKPITGIYPSPFNYKKQALLGVPHDILLPDRKLRIDPLYMEQLSGHIAQLASVSGGRMLILFTSRLIMREMAPRLQARLRDKGIFVLSQTDAGRSSLVDRLRDAPRKGEKMVLLGLRAFWEGIDVAGEALSVLVVSKLPFEYYGHPVAQAKRQFYENQGFDRDYFKERIVPEVFLNLRQMYGRLIRTETDRGATIISDPRIYVTRYGKHLLQQLPETTTVVDKAPVVVEAVGKFLRGEEVSSSFVWGELPEMALDLSPEQRAIVMGPSKRILVRAAAGSGKTHVLISRLIRLVEMNAANPEEVLALTFTNKAMNVMYERLELTLGGDKAYRMHNNVLTYHKLAMRIIRQDDKQKGAETGFIGEDNPELQNQLFKEARIVARLKESDLNDEDARTLISYAQNGLVNESELAGKINEWKTNQQLLAKYALFFLEYSRLLREQNLMDYGEAIVRAVNILRNDTEQSRKWNNRFKWIFCDEYQDTSPAQATLLQLLGQQANLFVVGDNAQSIYSWQGSDPDNLSRFELDFPNTATYNLSKNYRCFPKLVRMSTRFLERSGQAHGIRMEYNERRSTEDQSVYFLHNDDDRNEAEGVIRLAITALELEIPGDPPPRATVGILARKWELLKSIEAELIRHGVPYKFEGETARGIVASRAVRQIAIRAADLCRQSKSEQITGDTSEGKIIEKLREGKIERVRDLLETVRDAMPGEELSGNDLKDFSQLCQILADRPIDVLKNIFISSEESSQVVLSTIHSQKGEEFDTVIVIGLEEGNSPHQPPKSHKRLLEWRKVVQTLSHATWQRSLTDEDLERLYQEEESRIFYVATTRARYNLVVSRANKRYLFGRTQPYEKSIFLDRSNDPKLVAETASSYDIKISAPPMARAEEGYRSDGRVFQTKSGVLVRSKSEMLLANEFKARGMYFEYEEPTENVVDALPDFTFPDYGGVILEHLGMLEDPSYLERWEKKAKEYEAKGIRYFRTNEEEIKALTATADRLREQFRQWVQKIMGDERINMINKVEKLRMVSSLHITRSIGDFLDGVFEVDDHKDNVVAIVITSDTDKLKDINIPGCGKVKWEPMKLNDIDIFIAKSEREQLSQDS